MFTEVLRNVFVPTIVLYHCACFSCDGLQMISFEMWVPKDKTDAMEELLQQLREDGLQPDKYTYNSVIYT